jgi:hypothetical protein
MEHLGRTVAARSRRFQPKALPEAGLERHNESRPMLPAWATVAISLGAALITAAGALLISFLRARQERALQLHDRRLVVAGDFSTSAHLAITALKDLVRSPPTGRRSAHEERKLEILQLLHGAEAQVWLVTLLFGSDSEAARLAEGVRDLLRDVEVEIKDTAPKRIWARAGHFKAAAEQAEEALKAFSDAALKVLDEPITLFRPRSPPRAVTGVEGGPTPA